MKEQRITMQKIRCFKFNISKFKGFIPFLGMVLVIIFFQLMSTNRLLTVGNLRNLLNEIFSIGLGSVGIVFLMSQGNIDFSVGAIVGFASTMAALAVKIHIGLLFPAAVITGVCIGLINGTINARFNVPSFIATLAVSFILKGITTVILNGSIGIPFSVHKYDNTYLKLGVLVAIMFFGFLVFNYSSFGKSSRAIGSLTEVAKQSGVNVEKVKLLSFIISGGMCGLVAFFSLLRTNTASTGTGSGYEFNLLLALMIGGLSLTGGWSVKYRSVVIGSVIIAVISNGMTLWGLDGLDQQLIKGILLLISVIVSFDRENVSVII